MNFSDRLANIGPVGPPSMGGGINEAMYLLQNIYPYIEQSKQRERDWQQNMLGMQLGSRNNRLSNIGAPVQPQEKPMDVVFQPQMTPYQQAEIGLRKQGLAQEKELTEKGLAHKGAQLEEKEKEYEGKLKQKDEQIEIARKKEQDIHETKIKDMERKAADAERRAEQARINAENKQNNAEALQKYRDAQLEALKAKHEAENAQRDARDAEAKRVHDAAIADKDRQFTIQEERNKRLQEQLDEAKKPKVQEKTEGRSWFGFGPKTTTTVTSKGNYEPIPEKKTEPAANQPITTSSQELAKDPDYWGAVKILQDANKPLTDANIKHVLDARSQWKK